jgi:tetratricopeptide (TPR) repeat protein
MMKKTLNMKIKNSALLLFFVAFSSLAYAQDKAQGMKYYAYKKYASAVKELQPLSGTDAMANYYLGLSYIGLEKLDEAKKTFQKNADDAANMAGLARIMFLENKNEEAMSMLESVAKKTKRRDKDPLMYAADAITYSEGGDVNKAIQWYKEYKEENNTSDLLIKMGDAYRKIQGGGGNAMTAYQNAADLGQNVSLSNYKQGNLWYSAKNYDSALACYERASKIDPENPLPYSDLASAYYQISKYELAKTQIEKYLKYSDNSPDDQIQYGNTLFLAKDYDGAIAKMNELLKSGNGKSYMYRVLGFSHFEKGELTKAKENMDLLFAKHPKNKLVPQDYFTYAKILSKDSTQLAKSKEYFQKGIDADTTSDKVELFRKIAKEYIAADDYANGAIWYEKVTQQESDKKEMLDYWWAGRSYFQVSNYAKAGVVYDAMIARSPKEPSGYYWKGRVEAAQDLEFKKGTASELFKQYLSLIDVNDAEKKNEVIRAYTYLALVDYYAKNYKSAADYANKLLALDPTDKTATQILANIPK